ncbi:uncharacterized protein [Panulirus ornatus]|uniref:uncharacterized protein isoform X2 n=1 Tax=Panulirus ornatus TaxID=150431 RepID=UPI003A8A5E14
MATSSTDSFNNTVPLASAIPLFAGNYPIVSVSTGANSFWPPGESTSDSGSPPAPPPACEGQQWEVDVEEVVKRRIYELKRQFHNGRYLIVRHLPRDANEEVCVVVT